MQLVNCSEKLARTSRKFIRDIRYAQEDARQFVRDVQFDSSLIRIAWVSLNRHCSDCPTSPVLEFISQSNILNDLDKKAERVLESLKTARAKIHEIDGWKWIMRVQWALIKKSVLTASPQLGGFKIDLQLILNTVQLELIGTKLKATDLGEGERRRLEQEM